VDLLSVAARLDRDAEQRMRAKDRDTSKHDGNASPTPRRSQRRSSGRATTCCRTGPRVSLLAVRSRPPGLRHRHPRAPSATACCPRPVRRPDVTPPPARPKTRGLRPTGTGAATRPYGRPLVRGLKLKGPPWAALPPSRGTCDQGLTVSDSSSFSHHKSMAATVATMMSTPPLPVPVAPAAPPIAAPPAGCSG